MIDQALVSYLQVYLDFMNGGSELSLEFIEFAINKNNELVGQQKIAPCYFYSALICIQKYPKSNIQTKLKLKIIIKQSLKKLKFWSLEGPMNFLHKYYLLFAEWNRVIGNKDKIITYYDLAIKCASENNYIQEEALANELAAKYFLSINKPMIAKIYMIDAYKGYKSWGALSKVDSISSEYSNLLFDREGSLLLNNINVLELKTENFSLATISFQASSLNLSDLTKAIKTLSIQIELQGLLLAFSSIAFEKSKITKFVSCLKTMVNGC